MQTVEGARPQFFQEALPGGDLRVEDHVEADPLLADQEVQVGADEHASAGLSGLMMGVCLYADDFEVMLIKEINPSDSIITQQSN